MKNQLIEIMQKSMRWLNIFILMVIKKQMIILISILEMQRMVKNYLILLAAGDAMLLKKRLLYYLMQMLNMKCIYQNMAMNQIPQVLDMKKWIDIHCLSIRALI